MTDETGPGFRDQSRFEFTYELEAGDFGPLLASQQAALKADRKPLGMLVRLLASAGTILLLAALAVTLDRNGIVALDSLLLFATGLVAGLFAIATYQMWFYRRIYPRKLIELNRLIGRRHRLEVDATGVHTRIPGSVAHYEWSAVERVDGNVAGCVLLWVSGLVAIIVPDRVFADKEQRAAFVAAAREWADAKT